MPCGPLDKLFHQIAARTNLRLHSNPPISRLVRRLVSLLTGLSNPAPFGHSVTLTSSLGRSVGLTDTASDDGRTECVRLHLDWMSRQALWLRVRYLIRTFLFSVEEYIWYLATFMRPKHSNSSPGICRSSPSLSLTGM
jgi:hypothetical protein